MLARSVPGAAVLVCETRAVAAALADTLLGATVLVLDDGFQHRMRRDVDVVLVAPHDLGGRRLPFGRLRSPVSALRRADAVVLDAEETDGSGDRSPVLAELLKPGAAVFTLRRRLGRPYWLHDGAAAEPCPAVALAAIARPGRFTGALAAAGWTVGESVSFRDHHQFTRKDLASVRRAMEAIGASCVVTTEKDAVRLRPLRPLDLPVVVAPLEVSVEPDDRFRAWIAARLDEARR
jgi:tetraacyldisaccharide 4'-kinase